MLRDKSGTSGDGLPVRVAMRRGKGCGQAVVSISLFVQALSCAGPPDSRPPAAHVRPSPVPRPSPEAPGAAAPAPPPELVVTSVREVLFREDLLQAVPSKISESEMGAVHLLVTKGAWLALDDHPPRQSLGDSLRLKDLLSEDQEIAPGPHALSVFLVDEKSVQIQVRSFLAGVGAEQGEKPGCVLWTGALTFNGPEQILSMAVLAVPTDPLVSHLQYELRNEEGATVARSAKLRAGEAVSSPSPLAGDLEWSVSCFVGTEQVGQSRRIVTLNPESAPVEAK